MIFLVVRETEDWDSMNGTTGKTIEIGLIEADSKEDAKDQLDPSGRALGADRWDIHEPGEFAYLTVKA